MLCVDEEMYAGRRLCELDAVALGMRIFNAADAGVTGTLAGLLVFGKDCPPPPPEHAESPMTSKTPRKVLTRPIFLLAWAFTAEPE
jgi:hypothetical protein